MMAMSDPRFGSSPALSPHSIRMEREPSCRILPMHLETLTFPLQTITTVDADRTLWDKVVILHGIRSWFEIRGEVRQEGQRLTRHYYDVHRLVESPLREHALENLELVIVTEEPIIRWLSMLPNVVPDQLQPGVEQVGV